MRGSELLRGVRWRTSPWTSSSGNGELRQRGGKWPFLPLGFRARGLAQLGVEEGAARGDGGPPAPAPCRSRAAHWPGRRRRRHRPGRPLARGTVVSASQGAGGGWRGRWRRRGRGTRLVGAAEGCPQGGGAALRVPRASPAQPPPREDGRSGPAPRRSQLGLRVRRPDCSGAAAGSDSAGTSLHLLRRPPSASRSVRPASAGAACWALGALSRTLCLVGFPRPRRPAGKLSPFYRCGLEAGRGRVPCPRPRRAGLCASIAARGASAWEENGVGVGAGAGAWPFPDGCSSPFSEVAGAERGAAEGTCRLCRTLSQDPPACGHLQPQERPGWRGGAGPVVSPHTLQWLNCLQTARL